IKFITPVRLTLKYTCIVLYKCLNKNIPS
ncbi:hypothetical protein X975_18386, partial [Stegodyphus mimosarum]